MPDSTSQKAADAISRQMSAFLGAEIEPGFKVIRYPPGYNFNVQYHMPIFTNPHTLALVDRLCVQTGPATASLTGASFSTQFAAILDAATYKTSSADAAAAAAAVKAYKAQGKTVIKEFESAFGRISKKMITASGAVPQSKSGYIADYVAKNYPQDPPSFPPTLAAFARAYQQWINQGDQLEKLTGQEQEAVQLVAMARANTLDPDAANGGMQTTETGWSVAYSGFPDNNTIIASLKDTSRTVRVQISLEQANGAGLRLSVDNKALGALPKTDLKLTVGTGAQTQPDLSSADKVEMEIVYSGITVIRADPVEISANLKTGWYSRRVLQELKKKTGQDVTGLQLNGSTFSVDDLFGPGKSFARVRTFVISQEPTVRMTIEGAGAASLAQTLSNQTAAQLSLDDILSIGSSRSDYSVLNVQTAQDRVIVDLGPPPTTGTVPFVDQTAHIIGGVINFPP